MRKPELREKLLENEIFAKLDGPALDALIAATEVERFHPGQRILLEGEPSEHLFSLLSGVVGVFYSSSEGADVLVKIFGPPAVFGEMELVYGQPRQEYVEAFEECWVAKTDGALFMEKMRADKEACYVMLKDVCARLCIAAYHERSLAFLDAPTRLAGLLLAFLDAYGEEEEGGLRLKLKLTYETLAKCLAVTTRSIDRAMKEWRAEGWLDKKQGYLIFTSRDALEERADPERLALFSTLGLFGGGA